MRHALAALALLAVVPARAEPGMAWEDAGLSAKVSAIEATSRGGFAGGSGAIAFTEAGPILVSPCDGSWCMEPVELEPVPAPPAEANGHAPLPDGGLALAAGGDIEAAWYVAPTTRYAHGVLGDAVEAGGLAARTADGALVALLPETDVHEDITPRLSDLDGDGRNEIVTLTSSADGGGSLAAWGLRDGTLSLLARTPAIGRTNRWLNVAAIEDLDGDGVRDVALVETPHIGGDLQLWSGASLLAGEPHLLAALRGYSNHAIGSRALDLSETVTIAGGPALVLPVADRAALEMLAFADGAWRPLARLDLPARVATDIASVGADLALGLEDGRLVRVTLSE